jgi:hypothetical protein
MPHHGTHKGQKSTTHFEVANESAVLPVIALLEEAIAEPGLVARLGKSNYWARVDPQGPPLTAHTLANRGDLQARHALGIHRYRIF